MKQSWKEFEREVRNAGLGILAGRLFFLSWGVDKLKEIKENRSDEGLTLETSAFLLFTVANLRFQPSC